ncbi:hypothetical protein IKF84_01335 [Candidatus Saccharibacteria bacterium]|nr:hypothetical protein [Candidatus Saccharibacteria bacterium]
MMIERKDLKTGIRRRIFGCFFAVILMLASLFGTLPGTGADVYAEPEEGSSETSGATCQDSLGSLGWLVCPTTGKISEAVDFLYDKIEDVLVINPVEADDGSPVYEIWKYFQGVTNIVFIIFLLVIVFSQITGWGINNYGVKKALPKLIIAAILVNLSFYICSLAVDVSNIFGGSIRGLLELVESSAGVGMEAGTVSGANVAEMYTALASGTALTVGGAVVAFETGAIWMMIPMALGALVSVVIGLITIAMRQAVVTLLIMVAPLAMVAYILPNTEQWFKKWKQMLFQMLIFYPAFSLLFGASSLAGWAIIVSSNNGFGILIGTAVQIFPLFFSWSLMKMSGTVLGTINSKLNALTSKPLAGVNSWAGSHRELSRQKHLAAKNAYTPSLRLMQFMSNRKIARDEETKEHAETVRNRGLAYAAMRNYNRNGTPSKDGEEAYEAQARNAVYQRQILRHKNNMNKGMGQLKALDQKGVSEAQKARLLELDAANVEAFDTLKMEQSRGAKIDYENSRGYHDRITNARAAQMDYEALQNNNTKHQFHEGVLNDTNLNKYKTMRRIMEGNDLDTGFILADAAHAHNAQAQIVRGKFGDAISMIGPTQDAVNILDQITKAENSNDYIDSAIAGMKVLIDRGDTDLARKQFENLAMDGKIELGTNSARALSNFFMFDVKGKDPFLRRFGKYINLETAKMFNEADPGERRTRRDISLYEYVNGEYFVQDDNGNIVFGPDGKPETIKTKRKAAVLLKGTSYKDAERTAIPNMNEIIRNYSYTLDRGGNKIFDYEKFKENQQEIWDAIMPNIIGDQFSYLSGSEQIVALGKGLTGMDVQKHKFDWEGIFGEDIAGSLTSDQKKDYIDFLVQRTKKFLGGQVPSQIAKTKTDILEAIRNQYAFKDAIEDDPQLLEEMARDEFKMSGEEYEQFENRYIDKIKDELVASYKEDALKGFVKMHHKGYQGEAKDGLIKLLNPDKLYEEYFGSSNKQNNDRNRNKRRYDDDDDDDDGMPVDMFTSDGPIYTDTRNDIESIYGTYRDHLSRDVNGFWNEIKDMIVNDPDMFGSEVIIENIEKSLPQYTTVTELYVDVINRLYGGFNND